MSEPCRHERDVAVHGALGAAHLEIERLKAELAGPCAHTALSRIYLEERDEARATIAERDASIAQLATRLAADDQDATIERVRALCDTDLATAVTVGRVLAALEVPS